MRHGQTAILTLTQMVTRVIISIENTDISALKGIEAVQLFMLRTISKKGVSVVRNHHETISWLKLDHGFYECEKDVFLCSIYLWPDESPINHVLNVNLFELLEQDVFHFSQIGSIILAGDFNARVGQM